MAALQTVHSPELKGLYANSNRFTQPKGTVPRLCNLYLVRRGAFHTVPGSLWVSSFDGLPPHTSGQQPIYGLKWYAPSDGSSPDVYLESLMASNVAEHNYILALQPVVGPPVSVQLLDVSAGPFMPLAVQPGLVSKLANSAQLGDYLVIAFGNNVPPDIFPTVTQTAQAIGVADTVINVASTVAFPSEGTILIDAELIAYTSLTATSFQGLTRGAFGTVAATHAAGTLVFLSVGAQQQFSPLPLETTLTAPMLAADTTATVANTAMFPASIQLIVIDSELIGFTGRTPTTFTNLARGQNGTTPAGHANGATVFGVQAVAGGRPFTQLTSGINAGTTVRLAVASTAGYPANGGFIYVDNELMQYLGATPSQFSALTRGVAGTTPAAHSNGAVVYLVPNVVTTAPGLTQIWAPITNKFDPSLIYQQWPGTQNAYAPSGSNIQSQQVAVNIGTIIYVKDGNGTAWLFRAQNSGVTGAGNIYVGPQFFPQGLIGTLGTTTSGSATLQLQAATVQAYRFTAAMVGMPITVYGAAAAGGDLQATILSVAGNGLSLVMSVKASTTINFVAASPPTPPTGANFVIGVGHFADVVQDDDTVDLKAKRGAGSGTEVWLNIGQAALSPPGAAFVFQHLNFLFLWGVGVNYGVDGITGPDALWQSDFGDPQVFNPANVTFAGKGDGTTAQGGAVYSLSEAGIAATPQLVLFKDASTYSFLNEFPNASLVEVSGGLGCIAPNTIQFIGGYGVMRLTYAGIALFDGQLEHVTEYTDAIRGYLFGGLSDVIPVDFNQIQNCVSTQTLDPPLYMFFAPLVGNQGFVTRGFGYDFGLKQWFTMDLPFAVTSGGFFPQAVVALSRGYQSLVGDGTAGVVRRLFFRDPDWDGIPIIWRVQFPDWGFPGTPVYVRRLNTRITADGAVGLAGKPTLTNFFFQGVRRSSQAFGRYLNLPRSLLGSADVGEVVLSGNVSISGTGQVLIEGTDAQTSEKPTARVGT